MHSMGVTWSCESLPGCSTETRPLPPANKCTRGHSIGLREGMFLPSSMGSSQHSSEACPWVFPCRVRSGHHLDSVHTRARGWLSHRVAPQASPCNVTVILCEAVRCRRVASLQPRRSRTSVVNLILCMARAEVQYPTIRVLVDHGHPTSEARLWSRHGTKVRRWRA